MGGLMKYMPLTAITAIIASFSISGVPLFNGFASKWAIYLGAIQGSAGARFLPLCAVIAILTSALTLASFIKFFGVSFLSRSSKLVIDRAAQHGRLEVPLTMQIPQVLLALLCVTLGIVPVIAFRLMQVALNTSDYGYGALLAAAKPMSGGAAAGMNAVSSMAMFVPVALLVVIGVMFMLVRWITRMGDAQRRTTDAWLCGYVREADCHRYVAHNFYGEIKRYFRWLGGMPRGANGRDVRH
jgi:NADH:ubiquinone oxidoreductase subunit 5 (subunit L)/multisubunit Na+/H+ antiporter MnhA subunit